MQRYQQKGRKDHVCQLCGQIIPSGEQYIRIVTKMGEHHTTRKLHIACDAAATAWGKCNKEQPQNATATKINKWLQNMACCECEQYCENRSLTPITCPHAITRVIHAGLAWYVLSTMKDGVTDE